MIYTVALTSQGQMSIPSTIRDLLGFSQPGTVTVKVERDGIFVKPTRDIMSLAGILYNKVKLPKGYEKMSTQEIINMEKESARRGHMERYEKSLR